ncbi:unnamed protein product [Ceratitis capitata]|uniref:(Mediterranean fruit fly) hypothetical protein n=1 Tax=Ceratitis capitata TaxID=7213 RepID=A0A811VC70_CERCA|nr:unnamed protein product [Ceratitis capitata]
MLLRGITLKKKYRKVEDRLCRTSFPIVANNNSDREQATVGALQHLQTTSAAAASVMGSVWKRLQRVNKRAAKFQFTSSYHELRLETTAKCCFLNQKYGKKGKGSCSFVHIFRTSTCPLRHREWFKKCLKIHRNHGKATVIP